MILAATKAPTEEKAKNSFQFCILNNPAVYLQTPVVLKPETAHLTADHHSLHNVTFQ